MGESTWSQEASFSTAATVPDKPDALACTADGPCTVLATWKAPSDGGEPINAYQLQSDDGNNGDFEPIYNGLECQFRATGLQSGLAYRFRVLAVNEVGQCAFAWQLYCCCVSL